MGTTDTDLIACLEGGYLLPEITRPGFNNRVDSSRCSSRQSYMLSLSSHGGLDGHGRRRSCLFVVRYGWIWKTSALFIVSLSLSGALSGGQTHSRAIVQQSQLLSSFYGGVCGCGQSTAGSTNYYSSTIWSVSIVEKCILYQNPPPPSALLCTTSFGSSLSAVCCRNGKRR